MRVYSLYPMIDPAQIQMMAKVRDNRRVVHGGCDLSIDRRVQIVQALKTKQNALLESPTGKSILCFLDLI